MRKAIACVLVLMGAVCAPALAAEAVDDDTAPAVTIAVPAADEVFADRRPQFSGAAGTAEGDEPAVKLDIYRGDEPAEIPYDTVAGTVAGGSWIAQPAVELPDGRYLLRVRQEDAAGNVAIVDAGFWIDLTAPAPSIDSPEAGAVLTDATPELAGLAGTAGGDDDAVTVEVFAGAAAAGEPVYATTVEDVAAGWAATPGSSLLDGTYTLRVSQVDDVGNAGDAEVTFRVDTTAPALTITSPAATDVRVATIGGRAGTATGDAGEVAVAVYGGATADGPAIVHKTRRVVEGAWTVALPERPPPEGTYTVQARQSDSAGHVAVVTHTFRLDRTAPGLTVDAPADTAMVGQRRPVVGGAAGTAPGDEGSVTVTFMGAHRVLPVVAGRWSFVPEHDLPNSSYQLTVTQLDAAGNKASVNRRFRVFVPAAPPDATDRTRPGVSLPSRVSIRRGRVVLGLFVDEPVSAAISLRLGSRVLATARTSRGSGQSTVRMKLRRGALRRLRQSRRRPALAVRAEDRAGNVTRRSRDVGVRGLRRP